MARLRAEGMSLHNVAMSSASHLPALDHALAHVIVEDAIRNYFRKRRSRVPAFVDRTFSLTGALETHRHALGHDLWRAPLNAALAGPQIGLNVVAGALGVLGQKETARRLRSQSLKTISTGSGAHRCRRVSAVSGNSCAAACFRSR